MSLYKLLRKLGQVRAISTCTPCANPLKFEEKTKWNSVVKDAERAVGYPTSFLSLRWILNDEIANVASHIRKLIGTNHPLLKTAKNLLLRNELPTWGLIVLLISKTAGLDSNFTELECDRTADILHSQRIVAEVTEMIKTSHLIHKGLINVKSGSSDESDLNFGNKLALLSGDYLLSSSFQEIARLKHFLVQETLSSTLRDLAESEFIGLRDADNNPIPSQPHTVQRDVKIPLEFGTSPFKLDDVMGNMRAEWTLRNILGGGSLLAKCCQCALILGNHQPKIQEFGYSFGRNLALAWQACLEKNLFLEGKFNLVSAPVMMHLEYDPEFYKEVEKALRNVDDVNMDAVQKTVMAGPAIEMTIAMQNEFSQMALDVLEQFPISDSRTALVNIIKSM